MALIILRRARWLALCELATDPGSLRVAFDGRQQVRLDELGDWEPITGAPASPLKQKVAGDRNPIAWPNRLGGNRALGRGLTWVQREGGQMRRYLLLPVAVLWALAGCAVQAGPGSDPPAESSSTTASEISASFSCTARSGCSLLSGVTISCSGITSCYPFADHVVCDDVSTFCSSSSCAPCGCDPSLECCSNVSCGGVQCYRKASTNCI